MNIATSSWDPQSSHSWARFLGLVYVPMFGPNQEPPIQGEHAILLDGFKSSFAFSKSSDPRLARDHRPLSWYWSANVRHALLVDPTNKVMFLRRWDTPRPFALSSIPLRAQGALELLEHFEGAPPPRAPSVIRYVLHGFRLIRQTLHDQEALLAIRLLNGFLLAVDQVRKEQTDPHTLLQARTFGEAMKQLSEEHRRVAQVGDLPPSVRDEPLGALVHAFLEPEPRSGCELHADLLFRHAASELYQEAHVQIERDRQTYLLGFAPVDQPSGQLPQDVRFTPANLARALVQQALTALGPFAARRDPLVVLDPACGSGIFLRECLRELAQRHFRGHVRLVGYDISPISTSIASFSLELAKADLAGSDMQVDVAIRQADALRTHWEEPDLILMNPPFVPADALKGGELDAIKVLLGEMATGRIDMAMAFIWNAARSLKSDGVLATVLPAPLLDNKSARAWRERLQEDADLVLLGRFEGYKYFRFSMVETAFLLFHRKSESRPRTRQPVQVLIAEEGAEDAALRLLRLPEEDQGPEKHTVEIFSLQPGALNPESWLPLRRSAYKLRNFLAAKRFPLVGTLFHVRQGIRTGWNKAFLLSARQLEQLDKRERRFFRPAAGQGTLRGGQLLPGEFVFYPYGARGLSLTTQDDLKTKVPKFYQRWLLPHKEKLAKRPRVRHWWDLSEKRAWQLTPGPKLVSKYFGMSGSFAYDDSGKYVVVQGYAWLWKTKFAPSGVRDMQAELHETPLPWAYLALLNSTAFAKILPSFCPRVQGGQFNLSTRFVSKIPIPNLAEPKHFSIGLVDQLKHLGKSIHRGKLEQVRADLDHVAARAYGLPTDLCGP